MRQRQCSTGAPSSFFVFFGVVLLLLLPTTPSSSFKFSIITKELCVLIVQNADGDDSDSLDWLEFKTMLTAMMEAHGVDPVCMVSESAMHGHFDRLVRDGNSSVRAMPIPPNPGPAMSELCENLRRISMSSIALCDTGASTKSATNRHLQSSSSCQQDAIRADGDGSGYLTESEYIDFVELRLDCPGTVESSFLLPSLWSSAHCLCEDQSSFCCNQKIDVQIDSSGYWSDLCESIRTISVIVRRGRGCAAPPSPAPTEQLETLHPTALPTEAPVVPYSKQFLSCVEDLKSADSDHDERLNLAEFSSLQSCGGNRIVDASVFSLLAEDSTAVSIGDAYLITGWDDDEQEGLLELCTIDACAKAPTLSRCESQLLQADSDGDGQLTNKEYASYLNMVSECRDPPGFVAYTLFETSRCVCKELTTDIFCCLLGNTIDISALDQNGSTLDSTSQSFIDRVCEVSSSVLYAVDGEPNCPPTESPTSQPVWQPSLLPSPSPTALPTQTPSLPPTTGAPVETMAPVALIAGGQNCVESLIDADRNNDQEIDNDEYWDLLVALSGCIATLPRVPFDIGFRSTICTTCIFVSSATCCLNNDGIDLSMLYDDARSESSDVYAKMICTANDIAVEVLDGCPIGTRPQPQIETSSPTDQETATLSPTSLVPGTVPNETNATFSPTSLVPSAAPNKTNATLSPSSLSPATPEPTIIFIVAEEPSRPPTESPTESPSAVATSSPLPDSVVFSLEQTETCIGALASADDGDSFLRPNEYLRFVVEFSQCKLITKLSEAQSAVFLELACRCLNDPSRFTQQCCDPQNAAINIDGSDMSQEDRSENESIALQEVCDMTEQVVPSVCAPPPTPSPTRPLPTSSPTAQPIVTLTHRPEASPPPLLQPVTMFPVPGSEPSMQTHVTDSPPKSPSVQESQMCRQSLNAANLDNDEYLDENEFFLLLRAFGNCRHSKELTFRQLRAFKQHACPCLTTADNFQVDCCGLNPRIYLGTSSNRARTCYDADRTVELVCPPPDNGILISNSELQRCASTLARSDNGDNQLTREEYSRFIESYEGCEEAAAGVDLSVASTFFSFSCDEAGPSGYSAASCLHDASINISGVSLLQGDSTIEEETKLRQLCTSASGLVDRECGVLERPSTIPDADVCLASLRRVDDGDGRLDRAEFFDFLQLRSPSCSHLKGPTAAHNTVFSIISCACIFTTSNPMCCMNGAGRVELNAAVFSTPTDARTAEQTLYVSIVCKAPFVTAFSCKKPPSRPFPMPSETDSYRVWISSANHYTVAAVFTTVAALVALLHEQ